MGHERDAMLLVRAELCDRVAALSDRLSPAEFTARVEGIGALAAAYGLIPVVRLAHALGRAVAAAGHGTVRACPTALYIGRLQDAIGCESTDERTSQSILASISVRLGG